ncbi:hypothetical protein [Streptomyces lancefieldiae]|uniref:Small CPxCG-related zinc finger protein n=1 Tax=Streptomyces lancefieldiae TaxID=3075520 RepID=A0ABU3AFU1_9ACTN|nr:hypothetical protein [Streptomyces sp. DSM 40712]MDT0608808.1 hypothetical protein [Streptomyces sp. DSM 40712]
MTDDEHVQHTWNLAHPDGGEMTIELWTDGYSVRVHGGPDDGHDDDRGLHAIEEELLPKYRAAGYRVESDYAVNDPESHDDEPEDVEPDGRPEACPECGSPVEYEANHVSDFREGEAWLCTDCKWGQYVTA